MKREFIKGLGIEDDVVEKIMAEHGKTVQGLTDQIETLKTSETGLKAQLTERDNDIKTLKKDAGDSGELKEKYEALQTKYKDDTKGLSDKIDDVQKSAAIKVAIGDKAHDPDLVISQIDKSKIILNEDGSVKVGLDDQVKSLQESKAFLFKTDKTPGGPGPSQSGDKDPGDGGLSEADILAGFGVPVKA
jgi:chromosome segregation ATPase